MLTFDSDRRRVSSGLHQTTQENRHVDDIALGEGGRVLADENDVMNGFWVLGTYSQHVEGNVCEWTDYVQVERDLRCRHGEECVELGRMKLGLKLESFQSAALSFLPAT